jgi:GT2 family glycosyltransferase
MAINAFKSSSQLKIPSDDTATQPGSFMPVRIVEIELGQPHLPIIAAYDPKAGRSYRRASCIVRLHTQPLGIIDIEIHSATIGPVDYSMMIWNALGQQINEHLQQDGLPTLSALGDFGISCQGIPRCIEEREAFLADAPFVSVIVPTHNRPEQITVCLQYLLAQDYPQYEIIVVDNAPDTNATQQAIEALARNAPRVRYIREDYPGSPAARNAGARAARAEYLAFTDDDVVVDRYWLVELMRGFTMDNDVVCTTGLILPLELETPAQVWFEQYSGYSKGFVQHIYDLKEHRQSHLLYPYNAGSLGSGASMAFKASILHELGDFDPVLENSSDIEAMFRVIIHGHKLVYRPAALLYHPSHRTYAALCKQIYRYGIWLTGLLTKILTDNPRLIPNFLPKLPYFFFLALGTNSGKNKKKQADYPKELNILEVKGMFRGPSVYLCRRWKYARSYKSANSVHSAQQVKVD